MCNKPKENFGASIGSVIQEHVCLEEKVVGIQIQVEELITLKKKKSGSAYITALVPYYRHNYKL